MRFTATKFAPAALLLLSLCFIASAQGRSQVAFRIEDRELIPEGIAYDPRAKVFYVGSTYRRKIVSVDRKGVARDFTVEAQEGLLGVKDELELFVSLGPQAYPNGMDLSGDEKQLFVAAHGGVRVIDVRDKSSRTLKLPDGVSPVVIDGLYFYKGSLIAVQPFAERRKVVRYFLDREANVVTKVEVIEPEHPLFIQPTTGVIVGRDFYYIANSQLQLFRSLYKPDGAFDRGRLLGVVVLRARL